MSVDLPRLKLEAISAALRGRFRKAAELFIRLARLDGYEPKWWVSAGEALRSEGAFDEALIAYLQAVSGWALHGQLVKAVEAAQAALEIDPSRAETPELLASLYARRDVAPPQMPQQQSPTGLLGLKRLRFQLHGRWYTNEGRPCQEPILIYPRAGMLPVPLTRPTTKKRRTGELFERPVEPVEAPPAPKVEAAREPQTPAGSEAVLTLPRIAFGPPPPIRRAPEQRTEDAPAAPREPAAGPPSLPTRLPVMPMFASLDEGRLRGVLERGRLVVRAANAVIVREGERGTSLFVVVEGEAITHGADGVSIVTRYPAGETLGERCLYTGLPRAETIVARVATKLVELPRPLVAELLEGEPGVGHALRRRFRDRLVDRIASSSPLFAARDAAERRALVERFRFLELEAGTVVVHEGYPQSGLFVLLCGQCDVIRRVTGSRIEALHPGAVAGGPALLEGSPATATVQTRTRAWLLGMPLADLDALLAAVPSLRATLRALPG